MRHLEFRARIANPPETLVSRYTRKEREFFFDYADFIMRSLNSPEVRENLQHVLEAENIQVRKMIDLRVMVFPARPLTGRPRNILHGSYNQDTAQISLYPLKVKREWVRQDGHSLFKTPKEKLSTAQLELLEEAYFSAVATLIHEVLHVKFETRQLSRYAEEAIVRKLEKKYAQEWLSKLQTSAPSIQTSLTVVT